MGGSLLFLSIQYTLLIFSLLFVVEFFQNNAFLFLFTYFFVCRQKMEEAKSLGENFHCSHYPTAECPGQNTLFLT